jgi:aryl sulfotransferase
MHKGTNARWRDVLSPEEIARYEQMARDKLGDACANWLATGEAAPVI